MTTYPSYHITQTQKNIAGILKKLRLILKIPLEDAAELAGMTPEKFFKFENGKQFVRQNVINRIIRGYPLPEECKKYVGFFEPELDKKQRKYSRFTETAVCEDE